MSATCEHCEKEMVSGGACSRKTYDDLGDGKEWERVPLDDNDGRNCHDCGVKPGALHHPGCDGEDCPKCGGQAIACDCTAQDDDEDEDA